MKHTLALTALAGSLTLGAAPATPAVAGPDPAVEDTVAATPAGLAELLGPDGPEGALCDIYLRMEMTGGEEERGIMRWATVIEDGHLVFLMEQHSADDSQNTERHVYTLDGEFVQRHTATQSPDYESTSSVVRRGDKVTVTSSYTFDGEFGEDSEETFDYVPAEDTIPSAWMSLALAYHLRAGHEQFLIRMGDNYGGDVSFVQTFACDDVGTEVIEVDGEPQEAHVLMMRLGTEMDGQPFDGGVDDEQVMQMYVLEDGRIVKLFMEMEGLTVSANAITAEQARAILEADAPADDDADDE